jgi:hypothetical protein
VPTHLLPSQLLTLTLTLHSTSVRITTMPVKEAVERIYIYIFIRALHLLLHRAGL